MNNNFNISAIETFFDKILKKKVSEHIFAGTLPNTLSEGLTDCVLIDCGSTISDKGPYAKGVVNIFLYAQPTSNGRKNVALLSKMEKALNTVLEETVDETYMITPLYRDSDYDSTYNMHFNIVAVNLIIR